MRRIRLAVGLFVVFSTILLHSASAVATTRWMSLIPQGEGESSFREPVPPRVELEKEAPKNRPSDIDSYDLIARVSVPGVNLADRDGEGGAFLEVSVPGCGSTSAIGKPRLPVLGRFIVLPDEGDARVEVLDSTFTLLDGIDVYPAQRPVAGTDRFPSDFFRDEDFYEQDVFYPEKPARLEGPVRMGGQRVMILRVYPVQFNPARRILKLHSSMRLGIRFDEGSGAAEAYSVSEESGARKTEGDSVSLEQGNPRGAREIPRRFVLNPDSPSLAFRTRGVVYDTEDSLLIVTPVRFQEAAEKLAHWKRKRGIRTEVRTTAETGDTAESIEEFIRNARSRWDVPPANVLLLGDAEFIPCHYRTLHPENEYCGDCQGKIGTDLYYATLEGDDLFPDVGLGRLSVDTEEQALRRVEAIIEYERNPPSDPYFYRRAPCIAFFQDEERDGSEDRSFVRTTEEIRSHLADSGYRPLRIYYAEPQVDPLYWMSFWSDEELEPLPEDLRRPGFAWDGNTEQIVDAVERGSFLLVHRGHGIRDAWSDQPSLSAAQVGALRNGDRLPVVWSPSCETGWFDNERDDFESGTSDDSLCFSEAWERSPFGGAAGIVASTRISYTRANDELLLGLVNAVWPDFMRDGFPEEAAAVEPLREMGAVMNHARFWLATFRELESFVLKSQLEMIHWFGDPTLRIWTRIPEALQVSHSTVLKKDARSLDVRVSESGAVICVTRDEEILGRALSRKGELVTVAWTESLQQGDAVEVTVTKADFRPYEGEAVVETAEPILEITSHEDGQRVEAGLVRLEGTATDAGRGGDGISRVEVNGVRARGDTASGEGVADWYAELELAEGSNSIRVTAYDGSSPRNAATTVLVLYRCGISIEPRSRSFSREAGGGTVEVTAAEGCRWTASSEESWIQVASGRAGEGDGAVVYTLSPNDGVASRRGVLDVGGEDLVIVQEGSGCEYVLSPGRVELSAEESEFSVDVDVRRECDWSAESRQSWIVLDSGSKSGSGNGRVSGKVLVNSETEPRTGSVEIAGRILQVTQEGRPCEFQVTPTGEVFPAAGGVGTVAVGSRQECSWSVENRADWIRLEHGVERRGSMSLMYRVSPNPFAVPRQATLLVAQRPVVVYQSGAGPELPGMEALFTATPVRGSSPLEVQFLSISSGDSTSWLWDFGDGTSSNEHHPVHTYTNPGRYAVSLTVTGSRGTHTRTEPDRIVVTGNEGEIRADFTSTSRVGVAPLTVKFMDQSSGEIVRRRWDFGDGGSSSERNPLHVYSSPARYDVVLEVTGAEGSDVRREPELIWVFPPSDSPGREGTVPFVGGSNAGRIVRSTVDVNRCREMVLLLSRRAADGLGRLYITVETPTMEGWEEYVWLRRADEAGPPWLALFLDSAGIPRLDTDDFFYFQGMLEASGEDMPFLLGGLEGFAGHTVIFKSWYTEGATELDFQKAHLIQSVEVAFEG